MNLLQTPLPCHVNLGAGQPYENIDAILLGFADIGKEVELNLVARKLSITVTAIVLLRTFDIGRVIQLPLNQVRVCGEVVKYMFPEYLEYKLE